MALPAVFGVFDGREVEVFVGFEEEGEVEAEFIEVAWVKGESKGLGVDEEGGGGWEWLGHGWTVACGGWFR